MYWNRLGSPAILLLLMAPLGGVCADEPPQGQPAPQEQTVEEIARRAKPSLVVIRGAGRERTREAIGTGFVVDPKGLVVTNLHVIGEGREFRLESSEGRELTVRGVHASDRHYDLAVIEVDPGDQPLPALPLAEPGTLAEGAAVVVLGNPLGLRHSVVSGVLSGAREVEGRDMLQLAIPVEPGNSGGPVLDRQGRVHGVVTLKSALTDNLGFAIRCDAVHALLERPNSVTLANWVRLGAVDESRWNVLFGARWQELGGGLRVRGAGEGFGGRSLCLSKSPPPAEGAFEIAVRVKLDNESGAAGLVFHSDGADRHYGFYPSGGKLRLSCFEGPSVYSWRVLHDESSPHYRPGQWNRLKVRVESERLLCYVNDQLVVTSTDRTFRTGAVGLAKFRETVAEFRDFAVAERIESPLASEEERSRLRGAIDSLESLATLREQGLAELSLRPLSGAYALREEAERLERRAAELRRVARDVHLRGVAAELATLADRPDDEIDLLRGALLIARLDEEELDVDAYLRQVDRMGRAIADSLPAEPDAVARRAALDRYLFAEQGFHGSRHDYYHPANSRMNQVLDDREGLPITLSVLYVELARRLGLAAEGVGLPGHFVVRLPEIGDSGTLVDVYEGGKTLSRDEAAQIVARRGGQPLDDEHLRASTRREILQRMLRNLQGVAQEGEDLEALLGYLDALVVLDPRSASDRGVRAVVRFQTGRRAAAIDDLDVILEQQPEGLDLERVRELRRRFSQVVEE